jgi:hypothetical protein
LKISVNGRWRDNVLKKIIYGIIIVLLLTNIVVCVKLIDLKIAPSTSTTSKKIKNQTAYSNPIDAYFLPRINNASCEAERRDWQDRYLIVWFGEFEKIIKIMKGKCKYQQDKDVIDAYRKSIDDSFNKTSAVLITEWMDNYLLAPHERGSYGNGTGSALHQIRAENLRNECLMLIHYCKKYVYPNSKEFSKIVTW